MGAPPTEIYKFEQEEFEQGNDMIFKSKSWSNIRLIAGEYIPIIVGLYANRSAYWAIIGY
jgi:hypothetical protein